jgi:hypothetical protein
VDERRLPQSVVTAVKGGRRARIATLPPFREQPVIVAAIETCEKDGEEVYELRALVKSVQVSEAISKVVEGAYGKKRPVKVRLFLRDTPEYFSVKAAGLAPFYDREWDARLLRSS